MFTFKSSIPMTLVSKSNCLFLFYTFNVNIKTKKTDVKYTVIAGTVGFCTTVVSTAYQSLTRGSNSRFRMQQQPIGGYRVSNRCYFRFLPTVAKTFYGLNCDVDMCSILSLKTTTVGHIRLFVRTS